MVVLKKIVDVVLLLTLGFLINGCTDVYEPQILPGDKVLFLEGGITDEQGVHTIYLKNAAAFNEKPEFTPVKGAQLTIIEDETIEYNLEEVSAGVYKTADENFAGTKGHTYFLRIETADGHVYESKPQVMPEGHDQIDSVYGLKEVEKIKYYNAYGDFLVKEEDVNQVYVNLKSKINQNSYYKFDTKMTLEYASAIIPERGSSEEFSIPLYMWETFSENDLSILESNGNKDVIAKYPLTKLASNKNDFEDNKYQFEGSITEEYDKRIRAIVQVETDTGVVDSIIYGIGTQLFRENYLMGWWLQIRQYSISKEAHTFWNDVKKLEETEGEIFDPIATQIRGNLICTTDPEKVMFGVFEVASINTTNAFVNFSMTDGYFRATVLDSENTPSNKGWYDTVRPPFWVDRISY